jgi:tetratricopeptide (TPR) repeat protein
VTLQSSLIRWILVVITSAVALAAAVFFIAGSVIDSPRELSNAKPPPVMMPPPTFVGSKACGDCHHEELKRWIGSHHQLAMQPATDTSVLGNFSGATIANAGITSTFFRRAEKFMVRTDGSDGTLHDYEIGFTFGVAPLQQYLIAMPGGCLQSLGIAWDSRSRERGGRRWVFLNPDRKIPASAPLHWTGIDQTWNDMCADCHSTNVRKNYDAQSRSYATTYAEIAIGCEACHGPGSNHIAWSRQRGDWSKLGAHEGLTIALDERRGATWIVDPATGNPRRSAPRASEREIQMCARCHARRSPIHEDYVHGQPVGDDYRVALLDEDLYFPDGQIKGEVYEYGSFIQSRMFHAGVTCSDCHEPHSLRLRAEGNNVCLQCHLPQKYDSLMHHFHKVGSAGTRCVECHMPTRTYMVVDERRDHSIRIPRPDQSVKLGTPNACNQCHIDKSAQWASNALSKWYAHPPDGFQRFAEALHVGEEGGPGAQQALDGLAVDGSQPAIARATALSLLARYAPAPTDSASHSGIVDDSALVRRTASQSLSESNMDESAAALASLLQDPVRAVRIETANVLAGAPPNIFSGDLASAFDQATDEYIAAQELNADRPEALLNLGALFARQGKLDHAEAKLKSALALVPSFAPAAVNLADLYRTLGREAEGDALLRKALQRNPDDAVLLHSLGLSLVRQNQNERALGFFAASWRIEPANARYAYVYAVALNDTGQTNAAIQTLLSAIKAHPYDRDSLAALVSFCNRAGEPAKASVYAHRLAQLEPGDQH